MGSKIERRTFLQMGAACGVLALGGKHILRTASAAAGGPKIISPGCRKTKVKIAKIYMGKPQAHWPNPTIDINAEVRSYEDEFKRMEKEFADVDFVVDELVTSVEQARNLAPRLKEADGLLLIHVSMGIRRILTELLKVGKPTMLFAAPYSGHEWTGFGRLREQKEGALLDCILSSDRGELAAAVRPIRAIHHLREAKILDVTARRLPEGFVNGIKEKFGTEIKRISRNEVLAAYDSIPDDAARAEAKRWISGAEKVVEPSEEEIFKSCKLALAFEKLLDQEEATAITVDCYGTMWRKLPAYPCIGFTRLNDMGLAGICESDLQASMTFILYQALVGRPGFVNDPTMDVSKNSIILAHCLGTRKMDGPDGEAAPYKLRSIMERQEGAVPQVRMRIGQKVTQAKLINPDLMVYFTGEIIETPDIKRGCRTKITVRVDGDAEKLWHGWKYGLHRITCYGDITKDLEHFCRFKNIELVKEC